MPPGVRFVSEGLITSSGSRRDRSNLGKASLPDAHSAGATAQSPCESSQNYKGTDGYAH
jgi:hypothetical protein